MRSRLYDDMRIAQFPLVPELDPQRERQQIGDELELTRPLDGMDWRVMLFLNLKDVRHAALMQAAMSAVAAAFGWRIVR